MRIAFYRSYTDDYQVRIINITDSDGALSNPCNVSAFKGYDNSEPSISVDQLDYTYVVWYVTAVNYELRMRTYEPGVGWGAQDNMSFQETMNGNYYGVFLHGVKPKCYPYNGCMFVWTNSSNCYFYVSPGFEWDRVENYVPVLSCLFPGNNSWEISCYPKMNITATDRNGEGMTVNVWASNDSISWYCFASYVLGGNMTLHPVNEAFNESYTYYYWNVTVTDYVNTNSSGVYHFHTGNCTCTCIDEIIYMTIPGLRVINPNPGNGSHSKNYLKEDATGLTTSVDVSYENFTTPGAAIPGSYSITIPATSFTGGDILENSSSVYANVQANETGRVYTGNLYAGQGENAGVYCIDRSFLSFDTSVIPDVAVIDSAHIGLVVYSDLLVEEEYVVCLQSVKPPIPHNPLLCTDYNKHAFPSTATLSLKNTTGYNDGDDFNLTLNSTGLSEINKTTTTNWILRSMNDIKAWVPDVYEDICFCAPSYVIPGSRPVLVVNYTVPSSNWRHIVNLTWCSNSSGSWLPFYTSTVTGNGTVTVPAVNFSSNMSYFWNVSYESNDTNSGVTDVFVFEAVSCGSGSGAVVMVGGRPWLVWFILGGGLGLLIGMVLFVRRKKK